MKKKFLAAAALVLSMVTALPGMTAFASVSAMDTICAPAGIIGMGDGSFLVTDTYNKVVWRVKDRVSTIYAGQKGVLDLYDEPVGGYIDAANPKSFFKHPWGIAPFLDGYAVSDTYNNVVRLVRPDKTQTATGKQTQGVIDGYGIEATFNHPTGLAAGENGDLYIADTDNGQIRKITTEGNITTVFKDLNQPTGMAWFDGALYVCETGNNRIIRVKGDQMKVVAGTGDPGVTDGACASATFNGPMGIAIDTDGTIYVGDTGSNAVRRIRGGVVQTLAICDQKAMNPEPISPMGIMISGNTLYVCDNFSKKVLTIGK